MSAHQFFQRCGRHVVQAVSKQAASSSCRAFEAALPSLKQAVASAGKHGSYRALGAFAAALPVRCPVHIECKALAYGVPPPAHPEHCLTDMHGFMQTGLARQPMNMGFAAASTIPKCSPAATVSIVARLFTWRDTCPCLACLASRAWPCSPLSFLGLSEPRWQLMTSPS